MTADQEPIVIDVDSGELVVDAEGIEYEPLHGEPITWRWSQVHHVAFEPGDGRGPFRRGLIGLMTRPRSRIFLTTDGGDLNFDVRTDIGSLRATARRIVIDAWDAAGKVSVAGETIETVRPRP